MGYSLMSRFSECWLSVSPCTDLFGVYVQEGMIANAESWERKWAGRDNLSNAQGDVFRRKVMLRDFHISGLQPSEGDSVEGVLSSEWLVAMSM